jgi:hypothetical protein
LRLIKIQGASILLPAVAAILAVAVVVVAIAIAVVIVVVIVVAAGLVVDEPAAPAFALGLRCAGLAPVAQLRALRLFVGPAVACAFVLIAVVGTGFCLGPWLRVAVFAPVATPMH